MLLSIRVDLCRARSDFGGEILGEWIATTSVRVKILARGIIVRPHVSGVVGVIGTIGVRILNDILVVI